MATFEQNRKKINKRLYEINTTMDRKEAYEATVDYIMKVSEAGFKAGVNAVLNYHDPEDWEDITTDMYLVHYGVKKPKDG